jgi:hypothetical protein
MEILREVSAAELAQVEGGLSFSFGASNPTLSVHAISITK